MFHHQEEEHTPTPSNEIVTETSIEGGPQVEFTKLLHRYNFTLENMPKKMGFTGKLVIVEDYEKLLEFVAKYPEFEHQLPKKPKSHG